MTTTVTVTTSEHAASVFGFPCEGGVPVEGEDYREIEVVPPRSSRDFVAHGDEDILVKELPDATAVQTVPLEEAGGDDDFEDAA